VRRTFVVVSALALCAVANALTGASAAPTQATAQREVPDGVFFGVSRDQPRAGTFFVGATAYVTAPLRVPVLKASCSGTLGGRPLRGAVHRFFLYQGPRAPVAAMNCGWRLPASSAGKRLTMAPPGCVDHCDAGGFSVRYVLRGTDAVTGVFTSGSWTVGRSAR
jgi:hypothetical protein